MGCIFVIPFETGKKALGPREGDILAKGFRSASIQKLMEDPTLVFVVLGYADKGDGQSEKTSIDRAQSVLNTMKDRCNVQNVMYSVGMGASLGVCKQVPRTGSWRSGRFTLKGPSRGYCTLRRIRRDKFRRPGTKPAPGLRVEGCQKLLRIYVRSTCSPKCRFSNCSTNPSASRCCRIWSRPVSEGAHRLSLRRAGRHAFTSSARARRRCRSRTTRVKRSSSRNCARGISSARLPFWTPAAAPARCW